MPKKSPSPPLPRVPVSDEVYVFARSCRSVKEAANKLICSQTTAKALRKDDRSIRVTPLELASMEMQVRRLTSLTAIDGLRLGTIELEYVAVFHVLIDAVEIVHSPGVLSWGVQQIDAKGKVGLVVT